MWSSTRHFALSMLVSRRLQLHPDVGEILGSYYSVFPFEVDFRADDPFSKRLAAMSTQMVDVFKNRWCSGVDVMGEINRMTGRSAQAAIPFVMSSGLAASRLEGVPGALLHSQDHVYLCYDTPQTLVDVIINPQSNGDTVLTYMVVESAFPSGMHGRVLNAFQGLAQTLGGDDGAWHHTRPVGPPAEDLEVIAQCKLDTVTRPVPEGLLCDALKRAAPELADALAVYTPRMSVTYAQLLQRAYGVATLLVEHFSVSTGDRIAVELYKSVWMPIAAYGVHLAGGGYVPLDPVLPAERIAGILDDASVPVVLTSNEVTNRPEVATSTYVELEDVALAQTLPRSPQQLPTGLAYIIYTSGSTGKPKGVVLDNRGPLNTCVDVNARFEVKPSDRIFGISSMSFDLSVYDLFGSTAAGAALVYPAAEDTRNSSAWPTLLREQCVTVWNSAPALMQLLLDTVDEDETLPAVGVVMLSGDWIPLSMPERIRQMAAESRVCSLGGATEASIWSIWYEIEQIPIPKDWLSIPYGFGMANQPWLILDEHLHPVPLGVTGELFIGGVGLAVEYLGDEEKTNAKFITVSSGERIYRTGDLGRWGAAGDIEFQGRIDAQVKIGGYRVEVGEIEHALREHAAVQEAVVLALGERTDRYLVAWVQRQTAVTDEATLRQELLDHLASLLPAYMVPRLLAFVETFPVTSNGKLDRKALQVPKAEVSESAAASEPTNQAEASLLAIWREMLGSESIGMQDSFFEFGGTSLRAMQLAVRLRKTFGIPLGINDILAAPTVKQLAPRLQVVDSPWSPLVALRAGGHGQPIFLVHPSGGQVTAYRPLLDHLSCPLYAFEAAGLQPDLEPDETIAAMATRFIDAMMSVRSGGPYTIGGWSFGGLVAFEIARLLLAAGQEVDRLILIDTASPPPRGSIAPWEFVAWFVEDLQLDLDPTWASELVSGPLRDQGDLKRVLQPYRDAGLLPEGFDETTVWPMYAVFYANVTGGQVYAPPPTVLPLRTQLLRATVRSTTGPDGTSKAVVEEYLGHPHTDAPDWGWRWLVGGVDLVETTWVEGSHFTLLSEGTAERVADILRTADIHTKEIALVAESEGASGNASSGRVSISMDLDEEDGHGAMARFGRADVLPARVVARASDASLAMDMALQHDISSVLGILQRVLGDGLAADTPLQEGSDCHQHTCCTYTTCYTYSTCSTYSTCCT